MRVTLESTSKIVLVDGVMARVWQGHTENGVPMQALIMYVAHRDGDDGRQFEAELVARASPAIESAVIDPRFVI